MSDSAPRTSSSAPRVGEPSLPAAALATRPALLEILLLLAIVVLATGLRVYQLGYKSLGLEEIIFVGTAQPGGLAGINNLAGSVQPPLALFIMRLLGAVSQAEWWLRLPSLLAGMAGVVAIWALGRSLLGRQEGLLAAFMLALSALHLDASQEVYSGVLLATLSTVLLWSLLRAAQQEMAASGSDPRQAMESQGNSTSPVAPARAWLGRWWPFLLASVLSLVTHHAAWAPVGLSLLVYPCFLLAAAPGPLSSLWREPARRRALRHLIAALAVVGLLSLPLAIAALGRGAAAAGPAPAADHWFNLVAAFFSNRSPWYADPLFVSTMLVLILVGLVWLLWRRRAIAVALTAWIALPLLAWFAAANPDHSAVLYIVPPALLVVAAGVTALARLTAAGVQQLAPASQRYAAWTHAAVLALFVLAFVKGSYDPLVFTYRRPNQDWKTLAAILSAQPGALDQVVLLPGADGPLRWYLSSGEDSPRAGVSVAEANLTVELERLCLERDAIYVAEATTHDVLGEQDARYLSEHFIQAPLAGLNLYYRNCEPVSWYGAGAEALFPLAQHADLAFPATRRAQEQFNLLAAQVGFAAAPDLTPAQPTEAVPAAGPTPAQPPAAGSAAPQTSAPSTPVRSDATPAPPDQAADPNALLVALIEADPNEAVTQVRLGALALQQGAALDAAGEHFQRAIDLDAEAWLAYGLWANSLASSGQITQAVQLLDQGLQALPGNLALQTMQTRWQEASSPAVADETYQATLEAGRSATRERRWEEAIASAQQAIAQAPARHEGQLLLGDAYRGLGELAQALQAYQRATELAPYLSILHGRQAEMLARLDRVDEAVAASLTALAIDQGRWENWYALGRAYLIGALADDDGLAASAAVAAAQRAEVFLLQAQVLAPAENQAPARSLAELRAALPQPTASAPLEATPQPTEDYASMTGRERTSARARADEALQAGRADEALAIYQQLAAVDSQDRASRMGVGNAFAALQRKDEALAEFRAISADWPDFPFARVRQGALLEDMGDVEGALAAYREAVRVAPDNADLHFTLAYALRRAGQRDQAIAAFEAGLALEPGRSAAQQALDELKAGGP